MHCLEALHLYERYTIQPIVGQGLNFTLSNHFLAASIFAPEQAAPGVTKYTVIHELSWTKELNFSIWMETGVSNIAYKLNVPFNSNNTNT